MKIERRIFTDALKVIEELRIAMRRRVRVFTFGNGGSASIANHMACDWMKGTDGRLTVQSLACNVPLLTAIANDLGYEQTCAAQLRWYNGEGPLLLISSSGSSKNIVRAARETVKSQKRSLIAFTGFGGGEVRKLAKVSVHIDSEDYGEIEDYHSQVMHEVARQLKELK